MLPLPPSNERRRQIRMFISQNWKTMTDEEMATSLKVHLSQIRRIRLNLGFKKPRGKKKYAPKIEKNATEIAFQRSVSSSYTAEKYVRENWKKMTDQELADHLKIKKHLVIWLRAQLGLRKNHSSKIIDRDKLKSFVSQNCQNMDDREMAATLKVPKNEIMKMRKNLGIVKITGPRKFKADQAVETFIRENWRDKSDQEMAKMLELQEYQVKEVRVQLRLLRIKNLLTDKTVRQKFLDLLKKHHYNMSKVAEDLGISREAVRQKVNKLGIKIEKSPAFYTLTHEHPWLIKASSFALEFYMAGSVVNLSHKYELDATVIHRFADELGLSLSPPKAPTVKSACSFCQKEILRPSYQMKSKTYFCSKTCQGKWLGQKSLGRKRNEKLTKLNCVDCGKLLGRFGSTDDAKSTTARCMNCYRKQQKANQQKREDFILQNWPALSDEQISVKLGLKIPKVAIIRYSLGLKKKDRLDPKARTEATNFIRQNWQNMTDDEITTALGLKLFSIQQIRRSLGLKRPTGRGREKIEECRSFIQENWQTQSDKKMVKALGVSLPSIRRIRLELGLFRRPKK